MINTSVIGARNAGCKGSLLTIEQFLILVVLHIRSSISFRNFWLSFFLTLFHLYMQAACHLQRIENTVLILRNHAALLAK